MSPLLTRSVVVGGRRALPELAQLADMVRRGNECKVEHGAEDLLARYGGGDGGMPTAAATATLSHTPADLDWLSLLEETKTVQVTF